jgi:glycosyltransferase involved in cell wall biosynthesis
MKVLYLFSNYRKDHVDKFQKGLISDNAFFGLFRLKNFNIETSYFEIEDFLPKCLCSFLRKYVSVYVINLFAFAKIIRTDFVIHVNSFVTQMVFVFLPFVSPKWVIYDYSLTGLLKNSRSYKQKILKWIVSRSSGIITLCEEEKRRLENIFPHLIGKIEFIPYGVDTKFFEPLNVEEEDYILSIGHDMGRDYQTLFEAMKGLNTKLIITDQKRAKKMSVIPAFVQVKNFSDQELRTAYARAKVIVIPLNTSGGFNDAMGCSTLVEALSMGKAILVTRTFTTESYVEDGVNALLVGQGNVSELRSKLVYLLNNDEVRRKLGTEARRYAIEKCESNLIARDMAQFFKKMI